MDVGVVDRSVRLFSRHTGRVAQGRTGLLLAGCAAHRGYLNFVAALPVTWVGATLGAQFHLRLRGDTVRLFPSLAPRINRALLLVEGHPVNAILITRYLRGLRIAVPIALGMSAVRWRFVCATKHCRGGTLGDRRWPAELCLRRGAEQVHRQDPELRALADSRHRGERLLAAPCTAPAQADMTWSLRSERRTAATVQPARTVMRLATGARLH